MPESVEIEDFTTETRLLGKVLDVSRREGVIDIGKVNVMNNTKSKKKKKKVKSTSTALKKLKVGEATEAIVELIKAQYVILSLPKYSDAIGYAPVHYCNVRLNDASERFEVNQRVNVVIAQLPSSSSNDVKVGEFYSNRLLLTVPYVDQDKANRGPKAGTKLRGVVSELQPLQALVSLPNSRKGRIHITETALSRIKVSAGRPIAWFDCKCCCSWYGGRSRGAIGPHLRVVQALDDDDDNDDENNRERKEQG